MISALKGRRPEPLDERGWKDVALCHLPDCTVLLAVCQVDLDSIRHLEIRLPVSGLERCPGCHPERSEGSLRPSSQTLRGVYPERSEGLRVTGILSKCLVRVFPLLPPLMSLSWPSVLSIPMFHGPAVPD